jgi:hypothetical protein
MISCIFTLDYEIYGNGGGSLRELVYEPADKLRAVFERWGCRFVTFTEVAELEAIETFKADRSLEMVKAQIRDLHERGFELGLHIHPQWFNAQYRGGQWALDYRTYNLCLQPRERIGELIGRSLEYLRRILGRTDYSPLSFRAGNWLFQPSQSIAEVLVEHGIKLDSSVFKGGLQHQHKLDYRRALRNGYFWKFSDDVEISDPKGALIEMPIYTRMVPIWKLLTPKRLNLQRRSASAVQPNAAQSRRWLDFLRFRHPLKFDFCRLSISELTRMLDTEIKKDIKDPLTFRPIIAIGHTKDLVDIETVDRLLSYLGRTGIPVKTFGEIHHGLSANPANECLGPL